MNPFGSDVAFDPFLSVIARITPSEQYNCISNAAAIVARFEQSLRAHNLY